MTLAFWSGQCTADDGRLIATKEECEERASVMGWSGTVAETISYSFMPPGCFLQNNVLKFNSDTKMKTPLHEACTCGSVDIVSMLLQAGALKDAHRTHSWTPLMYAVSRNHFQVAVLFMQLESNTSIINEVQRLLLR